MIYNIYGKFKYIKELIFTYNNWYTILIDRIKKSVTHKVKLRNGITVNGGSHSIVVDLVSETFANKLYNPSNLNIKRGDIVVDIGANIGVYGLYAAQEKAKVVYEIEPLDENIPLIRNNFKNNNFNNYKIINVAVSDFNGTDKLYIGDLDSHGLLFDHNFKEKLTKYKIVKTMTLDNIFLKYKIDKVDFLKIDCEGGEGYIFKTTNVKTWRKINKIAIEYHDNVSVFSHQQILTKLSKLGYRTKLEKTGQKFGYIYAWRNISV